MQHAFGTAGSPVKLFDTGPNGGYVGVQVLDGASTLHFDTSKETLMISGQGNAGTQNAYQGFQLKQANGFVTFWWQGEFWALSDTAQGLINYALLLLVKRSGAPSGGALPEAQISEN